jgi:hypothetical protein
MPLLIIAFALLLSQVSPIPMLLDAGGVGRSPASLGWLITLVLSYGIPLLVSWWSLDKLNVRPFTAKLPQGLRLLRVGMALFAIYCLIGAERASLLDFLAYRANAAQALFLLATRAYLVAGVLTALCIELPRARLGAMVHPCPS